MTAPTAAPPALDYPGFLEAARPYTERGEPVLPLPLPGQGYDDVADASKRPNGKLPVGALTPRGVYSASADPATIEDWAFACPGANVGRPVPPGVVVLDVDPRNGGDRTLASLEAEHEALPETRMARTGGGGWHRWYRLPEGVDPGQLAQKLGEGIDVLRAPGDYVVVPPSATERPYEWVGPPNREAVPLPAWVLERLLATDRPATAPLVHREGSGAAGADRASLLTRRVLRFVACGAPGGEQRDEALAAIRNHLEAGFSEEETTEAVWRGIEASPCTRPDVPWALAEVRAMVANLARNPGPPLRQPRSSGPSMEDALALWARLGGEGQGASPSPNPGPNSGLRVVPRRLVGHWDDDPEQPPEPESLVQGLLIRSTEATAYGPSGCGKTTLALDLVLHIGTGRDWHGYTVRQGPVVYLAAEGASGLRRRIRAWKQHHGYRGRAGVYVIGEAISLLNSDDSEALLATLRDIEQEAGPLAAVVVDTLSRSMDGGDENSARDVMMTMRVGRAIREGFGATVLFLHHTGKSGETERGSSALRGACDTMLKLTKDGAVLTLTVEKQRDIEAGPPRTFRLTPVDIGGNSEEFRFACVLEALGQSDRGRQLTASAQRALETLAALESSAPEGWVNVSRWREVCEMPRRTFFDAANHLHSEAPGSATERSALGRSVYYRTTPAGRALLGVGVQRPGAVPGTAPERPRSGGEGTSGEGGSARVQGRCNGSAAAPAPVAGPGVQQPSPSLEGTAVALPHRREGGAAHPGEGEGRIAPTGPDPFAPPPPANPPARRGRRR